VTSPAIHELGEQLGIAFHDPAAISAAFVHASFANENPALAPHNNERLEFLGDAVLGVIASRVLYERFPDTDEGGLTAHRAAIVNRTALADLALELSLDAHLLLGRGELEAGGARRPSLLAGVFEALVGAVYLSEGMSAAEAAFAPLLAARLAPASETDAPKSAKSRLQEWSQRNRGVRPSYRVLGAEGPAHAQQFTVQVVIGPDRLATGSGSSRQRAEEQAAHAALEQLAEEPS
jgi:ribonuclease-3